MVIMLLEPFTDPSKKARLGQIGVVATAAAAYCLKFQWGGSSRAGIFGMFLADNFSIFFQWLFLVITAICILIAIRFNEREACSRGEYHSLLLFACMGMSMMAGSQDLILTFLGIEILSIATYVLAGFKRGDVRSNESALKYFLLGSFATGFLLYGIALVYGSTGSTQYPVIRDVTAFQGAPQVTLILGLGLLLVGFCFKIALVPFHAWAPDVYEGAPTAVTAFMMIGPKAAGFAALMRILVQALPALGPEYWTIILWVSSILSMTLGNVVALRQNNIKRMLAYSSIAHAGYILIGLVSNSNAGFAAVLFYLVSYSVMNLGALTIVLTLSGKGDSKVTVNDFAGLGKRNPVLASALTLFLISLAGIPLTGGFIGKFYLFGAAIQQGYIGLAILGVLNSVVSVAYYFRIIVAMYMREPQVEAVEFDSPSIPVLAVIAIAAAAILMLGIYPSPILNLAGHSSLALK